MSSCSYSTNDEVGRSCGLKSILLNKRLATALSMLLVSDSVAAVLPDLDEKDCRMSIDCRFRNEI